MSLGGQSDVVVIGEIHDRANSIFRPLPRRQDGIGHSARLVIQHLFFSQWALS